MGIGRRVGAVLAAVAVLFLVSAPARADQVRGCRIATTGEVRCDGSPVPIGVSGRVVQIVAAGDNTCALTEPGAVYCWSFEEKPPPAAPTLLLIASGSFLIAAGLTLVLVTRSERPLTAKS